MTRRTFLALPLGEKFKEELSAFLYDAGQRIEGIKWVVPESVHVTLHFFGATLDDEITTISEIAQEVASVTAPLCLSLTKVGFFPDARRPRIVWVGISGHTQALIRMQSAIEARLRQALFPVEKRSFKPHATIGRTRRGIGLSHQINELRFEPTAEKIVDRIVLFESVLMPAGARYTPIATVPLKGRSPG